MKTVKARPEQEFEDFNDEEFEDFDDMLIGMDEVEGEDSADGFPQEHMEPLRGLLFAGSLSKNFTYAGHEFLIETLTEGEVLRIGQLMASYRNTFSIEEARRCFTVAACVKSVDGYAIVTDIEPTTSNLAERIKVVERWYPPVISYVYDRYLELEATEFAVMSSLKK